MAPASSLFFPRPVLPSPSQTALAFAILQTKPATVTIRDYVLQLREHCKPGQPAQSAEEHGHYLDLVGYWREECRKAQAECDRLQSINIQLERCDHQLPHRTSTLLAKEHGTHTNNTPPNAAITASPSITDTPAKRKAPAPPLRPSKRSRASADRTSENSIVQIQDGIESDFEFLQGLGDDGAALLEALYTTHRLCRTLAPEPEILCRQLVRTSSALAKIIRLISHNHESLSRRGRKSPGAQSLREDRSDFSHALTISARAFMSVLVGITKMIDVSNDDRLPSLVVCELAETFKAGLSTIESSAQQTASMHSSVPLSTQNSRAKAPKREPKESVPARSMAHFLVGLMGLLNKTNSIHQRLFDAFAFVVLERVGKRLFYCTFGRHRRATIEDDLLPLPEPLDPTEKAKLDCEALGIRLELKALVLILERAMGLAPHHMNPASGRAAKNSDLNHLCRTLSMRTLPAAPKGRLSPLAKDRLQRTLITCMYGGRQDDEFLDVLTKPMPAVRIGALHNVAKIENKDVEQWYKEEVWRLVGWDIMAREGGW